MPKYCLTIVKFLLLPLAAIFVTNNAVAQTQPNSITGQSNQPNNQRNRRNRGFRAPVFSGQKVRKEVVVPAGNQEVISDIVVRFVDEDGNPTTGKTNRDIITREFELEPGDVYRQDLAKEGLSGVLDLIIVERASLVLEPAAASNRAVMAIAIEESSNLNVGFGLTLPPPTALQGPVKPITVNALSNSPSGFGAGVRLGLSNLGGNNQGISLGIEGGTEKLGFDLGYRKFIEHDRGFGVNFFNRRGIEPEFDDGEREVNLTNGADPWVHRLGGGVEYFTSIGEDLKSAVGVSYQRVSVRDGAFSDDIEPNDELGNSLTVSDDGQDDLLTLNFAAVLDRRDNTKNPTSGYQLQFGSDQYIPVGDANIFANRLALNYTTYIPAPLFGFTEGAKTLVFNLQGGTILGDTIPYDSFILGGSSSVRGYDTSEIATSRSFIQASVEYRYPILGLKAFKNDIDVGGTIFVDYATDLGSSDAVFGQPAIVRDRPGDGLGYGLGLRALTPIGAVRTEFALNDQGDSEFIFTVGDRF